MANVRERIARWFEPPAPEPQPAPAWSMKLAYDARAAFAPADEPVETWTAARPAPGVVPAGGMALDALPAIQSLYGWAALSGHSEGVAALPFQYLAELAQRPEYRMAVGAIARHATRKWIKLHGAEDDKLGELEAEMKRLNVRARMRKAVEHDGFFGRGQIFPDYGDTSSSKLATPLVVSEATVRKGSLRGFTVVEPVWSYPGPFNSTNPLAPDFYQPSQWYVMGQTIHTSRLLTMVGREVPDMLKPAYSFGGLSLSQMGQPYVDNWLRTRSAVGDLIHSFSTMILYTDMSSTLSGVIGAGQSLVDRAKLFNRARDNQGLLLADKERELLANVTTPLSGLDKLQAQSQEHMASVWGIPLIELLGVTPSGLNASSDGEVRTFYANIKAGPQEAMMREPLHAMLDIMQLNLWGAIDPKIGFEFVDLWEVSEVERATVRKTNAETDAVYANQVAAISPEEIRERLVEEDSGLYQGVGLSGPAPEPPGDDTVDGAVNNE